MNNEELRRKWRNYLEKCDRIEKEYEKWYRKEYARITTEWRGNCIVNHKVIPPKYPLRWPEIPPFPEELRGLS